jgi:hypothetical protein
LPEEIGKVTVVFFVSPSSMASKMCRQEVDQGQKLSMRLAPESLISAAELSQHMIPGAIQRPNRIFFSDPSTREEKTNKLAVTLKADRQWWLEHTRLVSLAVRGQDESRKALESLRSEPACGPTQTQSRARPSRRYP